MRLNVRSICINGAIILASCFAALILCEFGARLFLNPSDYLSLDMVPDPILGRTASPGTSGFDKWGFRNPDVPETAEIVALGDSHTYGNMAKMKESWPHVLQNLAGKRVYNLGLGGYGPNQYFHLFKTKALALKPKHIICGLYMGDDFENAYLMTYGLDHWKYLRQPSFEKSNADIWEVEPTPSVQKKIRVWLSRHSVVYKIAFHGSILGRLKGRVQIEHAKEMFDSATSLIIPEKNIREAFLPKYMLQRLDQGDPRIQEGMRITFKLIKEMNEISREKGIRFTVAVIPTKETVFADYIEHNPKIHLSEIIDKHIANERQAREKLFKFLADSKIEFSDTLPALKASVQLGLYAPTAADMHPGKEGYRVIAEKIFSDLHGTK